MLAARPCPSGSERSRATNEDAEFGASGTVITFRGFLAAYEEGRDEDASGGDDDERRLPPLEPGDHLDVRALEPQGDETTPPARYTEATLVKALEERGIGRPSTVRLDPRHDRRPRLRLQEGHRAGADVPRLRGRRPAGAAFRAARRLRLHRAPRRRPRPIAAGDEKRVNWLDRFYYGAGNGEDGLHALVTDHLDDIDARAVNSLPIGQGHRAAASAGMAHTSNGEERASVPRTWRPTS